MSESRGIDLLRESDTSLLVTAYLIDAANAKITAGATTVRVFHIVPTTGAFESYDFNDNTFKTTALTTPTLALTHRTTDNATYNTGTWTVRLTTLTAFTVGDKYIYEVSNASLPAPQQRLFQYGGYIDAVTGAVTTVTNLTNAPTAGDFTAAMKAATLARVTLVDTVTLTTTATSLTNAPTNGDLTATMKTSVTTAATASTPTAAAVTGSVGGNVLGSVAGSVVGSVGSVVGITSADVGAIKAKTDTLPASPANETTSAAIKAKTDLIPAGGPPASSDYTAARAARLDFLDMAISAVPGGVPSISGTVSVAPAPTTQGFTTNLNYPANYLKDGVLRFAGGAMLNVAVRIASNTAGPNSALTFVMPTPAVAVAGVAFSVSTEDRHGAPAAPGGF